VVKYSETFLQLPKDIIKIIAKILYSARKVIVGDIVDVVDTVLKIYPSVVTETSTDAIKIHYYGWVDRWDEWLPLTSPRIAPALSNIGNPFFSKASPTHLWTANCKWCTGARLTLEKMGYEIPKPVPSS
jgi:hypothetical protein